MAYGLEAIRRRPRAPLSGWNSLDRERRLAIVDRTLGKPVREDLLDGFPAAL